MIAEFHELKDRYFSWLKDKTTLHAIDDWVEVTTPFLDRHNDYMQIYVRRDESGYLLTDDGYTISDLEMSGCHLDTTKRQNLLASTLRGFGVQRDKQTNELFVNASDQSFPVRKHNLIQAMLAVNDLFYLASPYVASFFLEDVESWLDTHGIRYSPRVKLTGVSGFDHHFDFVIPKSRSHPERMLLSLNRPDRAHVERTMFAWEDTKGTRSSEANAYVLLNDTDQNITETALTALRAYKVNPILWSERETVREELAA
ncbi:MAG: DUF1829 domain-containing protein [Chloroflexota bacterium]|nr:DUF1829 domain-containing protein [Chloroflexota bacterium]MDE2947733.1 DUF1829 domain-containing protein [Chloroflexota bacterium]